MLNAKKLLQEDSAVNEAIDLSQEVRAKVESELDSSSIGTQPLFDIQHQATTHATFWQKILTALIECEGSQAAIDDAFEVLLPHQREKYQAAFTHVQGQLGETHSLYRMAAGKEIELVVDRWLEANDIDAATIEETKRLGTETSKFIELAPDIGLLLTNLHFFERFTEGAFGKSFYSHALLAHGEKEGVPSAIIIPHLVDDLSDCLDLLKHEVYRLIQWVFEDSILPRIEERDENWIESFRMFRQEVGAHLVGSGRWTNVNELNMVYTNDPSILKEYRYTTRFYESCTYVAESAGLEETAFIYAAARSQNFADFRKQCSIIASIDLSDSEHFDHFMEALLSYCENEEERDHRPPILEAIELTGFTVTAEFYKDYASRRLKFYEGKKELMQHQFEILRAAAVHLGVEPPEGGSVFPEL